MEYKRNHTYMVYMPESSLIFQTNFQRHPKNSDDARRRINNRISLKLNGKSYGT